MCLMKTYNSQFEIEQIDNRQQVPGNSDFCVRQSIVARLFNKIAIKCFNKKLNIVMGEQEFTKKKSQNHFENLNEQ